MATVERTFIFDGSQLSRAYHDRTRSSAVVICAVSDVGDTSEAKSLAVDAAVAAVGTTYPHENSELPLYEAKADIWASGQAWVTLVYARGQGHPPLQNAFSFAREVGYGERNRDRWYLLDTNTTPYTRTELSEGYFDLSAGQLGPIRLTRREPVSQIIVPTIQATNPMGTLGQWVGYTNSDDVVINGITREAFTLKFLTASITPVDLRSGLTYLTEYVFDWFPAGYDDGQRLFIFNSSVQPVDPAYNGEQYGLFTLSSPKNTAFADLFPTHDGAGPDAATP